MNIIFLDVDGPLLPGRMYYAGVDSTYDKGAGYFRWDPVAIGMIEELCKRHDAKVVFSTSHNEIEYQDMIGKAIYNNMNIKYLHEHNRTEFRISLYKKLDAVVLWLREHPEAKNWVIIDDEEQGTEQQVLVNFNIGMTIDNFWQAEAWLQGEKPNVVNKLII